MIGQAVHQPEHLQQDPYAAARGLMIEEQLHRRGVVLHSVLDAMREIPRHLFVAYEYADRAYADEALPSQEGQTISQPYIVAVMTQELAVRPGHRVLEIGTGTGYQTAVLAYLVTPGTANAPSVGDSHAAAHGVVCTIERVPALAEFARHRLEAMDVRNVRFHVGDGSTGWPLDDAEWNGPRSTTGEPLFDRILLTAGAPELPAPLLAQLAEGGILVGPIGTSESQTLTRVVRHGLEYSQTQVLSCRFVPLVGSHGWHE